MKKKARMMLIGAVAALGIAAVGGYVYLVNNPWISIGRSVPVNSNASFYFAYPSLAMGTFLDMPLPAPVEEKVTEFEDWLEASVSHIKKTYVAPAKVVAYGEVKDGQTRFWYEGTVTTQDGETVPFFEEKVFDWVLVPDEALSQLKTSPF